MHRKTPTPAMRTHCIREDMLHDDVPRWIISMSDPLLCLHIRAIGDANPLRVRVAVLCGNSVTVRLALTPLMYSCRAGVALTGSGAT